MGLRRKLSILSFVITVVSIFVTAVLGFYFNYNQAKVNIDESMGYESQLIIAEMDRWLDQKIDTILLTARIIENNNYGKEDIEKLLTKINTDPEISDVYMGFEDGSFISSIGWIPPEGYDPRVRPWYTSAIDTKGITFSEPYLDMTTGKLAVSIGVKSKNQNNELIGIIAEDLLIETVFEKMSVIKFKTDGYAFIINSSGYLLAHPDEALKNTDLTKNPELKDLINQMLLIKNGKLEYEYKGIEKRTIFNEIESSKWIVGITIPKKAIYDPLNNLIFQFIFIFVTISLISIFAAGALSRNIIERINKLLFRTVEISTGNYNERVTIEGDDEITDLSQSFNDMAENIQNYNTKLEEMVDRATKKTEETQKQLMESEKIASLSYLVNGIAHEINTPVGNCITLTSFIEKESENIEKILTESSIRKSDLIKYVGDIKESSHRLMNNLEISSTLISNFKELSTDKLSTPLEKVDLEMMIRNNFDFVSMSFKEHRIILQYDAPDQMTILTEPIKIDKLFKELMTNSFIHGFCETGSGIIHISIQENDGYYEITYADDGISMDDEVIKNIFTPFYTTKFSKEHNGLGMSLVYNLVKGMNGDIKIKPRSERGITIVMTLKG